MEKFLVFEKCCCCIELRLGCIIYASVSLVFNLILFPLNIIRLHQKLKIARTIWLMIEEVVLIVMLIGGLIITILLLVGLYSYKRSYIKIYLIYGFVALVLDFILNIIDHGSVLDIISDVIFTLFSLYLILVVRSYYLKMPEGIVPAAAPPSAPQTAPPRAPPKAPPTAPPMAPPKAPTMAPPTSPPTSPPTAPPTSPPTLPPTAPPTSPPTAPQTSNQKT